MRLFVFYGFGPFYFSSFSFSRNQASFSERGGSGSAGEVRKLLRCKVSARHTDDMDGGGLGWHQGSIAAGERA